MALYGYARVSSRDQNEDRQLIALAQFGVAPEHIFIDKQSGKDFERPEYRRLASLIRPGDVIAVKAIDRLGRNYDEIIDQWRLITKEKAADIVVLDMPLLDTRAKGKDLTGTFIADLVLQILSYVAETERNNIRQRQAEGIAAAKKRGVRFGAPRRPVPRAFPSLMRSWQSRSISARSAAKALGISPETFRRWCAEIEKAKEPPETDGSHS